MWTRPTPGPAFALLLLLIAAALPGAAAHPEPYLVRDLAPGPAGLGPSGLHPLGGRILEYTFELVDTSGDFSTWTFRSDLVVSDGTAPGTFRLLPGNVTFAWWWPETGSAEVNFFGACRGPVQLAAGCSQEETALWRTDGTRSGTFRLTEYGGTDPIGGRGPDGLYLEERGLLFFRGAVSDGESEGYELWGSDGTTEGTRLLADLHPEGGSSPGYMAELGGDVYFAASVPGAEGTRARLARSDGTPEGTVVLPNPDERATVVALGRGDDELFAFWWVPDEGMTLWRVDGGPGGPTLLADLGAVEPLGFDVIGVGGDTVYFLTGERSIRGRPYDAYLWASDGTPGGTRQLPRPPETVLRDRDSYLFPRVLGDRCYFLIDDGVHGLEPWVSDGTPGGTRLIRDFCPGECDGDLFGYQELLDEVVIYARLDDRPHRNYLYDPATAALRELEAGCPGGCPGFVHVRARVGSLAYVTFNDGVHGIELWVTDGTPGGTTRVSDFLEPGNPFSYTDFLGGTVTGPWEAAGGRLFFGVEDEAHGWELWAVPLPAEGTEFPPRPPAEPLTSPEVPGYAVWTRIGSGPGEGILGRAEDACIPETLCISGAVPGRSEVFVRVVGPKPNGFLWPTLVKFTTSTVEVWIEQLASGLVRYYRLDGASPGSSELPGLFDRAGFPPE